VDEEDVVRRGHDRVEGSDRVLAVSGGRVDFGEDVVEEFVDRVHTVQLTKKTLE
jgi:hypothetical protein